MTLSEIFENLLFYDENDNSRLQKLIIVIIGLYILTVAFFLIFGITGSDLQAILSAVILVIWLAVMALIFKLLRNTEIIHSYYRWFYLPGVVVLAISLETPIYFIGGGLSGTAESLEHDLILTIPVYLGIGIGSYIVNWKRKMNPGEFFLLGGIMGFIIEIVLLGRFDLIWFFLGGVLGMYGAVNSVFSPAQDDNEKEFKNILLNLFFGTILCCIFIVIGAFLGHFLYESFFM